MSFSLKTLSAAVLTALLCTNVNAAGLGRLTVLSALGQPLRAEIELTSVSKEEVGTLVAKLAPTDAYRQAGIEFSSALFQLRFAIEQRNDRQFIRVTSTQPVNEPFIDMLLQLSSGSNNQIIREYTFLLDPVEMRSTQSAQVTPQIGAPNATVQSASVPQPSVSEKPSQPVKAAPRQIAEKPAKTMAAARPVNEVKSSMPAGDYEVKAGDTLHKIALQYKQEGVSLDQMLVALYRANSNAFVGKNMNRLRTGQLITVPEVSSTSAISQREARGVVVAQAVDFNNYRNKLAGKVAASAAEKALDVKQSATGKITTKVEEKPTAANASQDKLKLTKPGSTAPGANKTGAGQSLEERIAKDKALAEANARVKELEKNVSALQKILEIKNKDLADRQKQADQQKLTTQQKQAEAQKAADAAKAAEMQKIADAAKATEAQKAADAAKVAEAQKAAEAAKATDAQKAADAAKAAEVQKAADAAKAVEAQKAADAAKMAGTPPVVTPAVPDAASAPAPVVAKPPPVAAPIAKPKVAPPAPETSMVDDLLGNTMLWIGLLVALLIAAGGVAFGVVRARRKKENKEFHESILTDSSLKANSLFGSTGGQSVDTNNSVFNSNFAPSSSQLDTNEVDPVAEADVYIAYGRDAQAEEILKEALRTQPERNAVRVKLLEIYANRKDLRAFEVLATELYSMTKGEGDDWAQAASLGLALDPNNPLYASGSQSDNTVARHAALTAPTEPMDDGLDLDALLTTTQSDKNLETLNTLGSTPSSYFDNTGSANETAQAAPVSHDTKASVVEQPTANALDFDLAGLETRDQAGGGNTTQVIEPPALDIGDIDFGLPQETLSSPVTHDVPIDDFPAMQFDVPVAEPAKTKEQDPLNFDLSGINLDLSPATVAAPVQDAPPDLDLGTFDTPSMLDSGGDAPSSSEMTTKLDLAIAYQEIGDKDGARELLDEVIKGGTSEQSEKAQSMLAKLA